ncbi:glycosyltransferase family 4 protein [Candidatus Woesearchaeota archaeon]|nr:glycosyltransferase family 4 protein [Candidatus Woesearchaeota archaeon]
MKSDMGKKVLVIATTFPRWKNDSTPSFVQGLSERIALNYDLTVLVPHHSGAKKSEILGKLEVKRFSYFKPEKLQKLCYGGGIIPNMQKSFLAKIQMPLLILTETIHSYFLIKRKNIKLIHAHWMLPQGIIGAILKKLFDVSLLVTVHGSDLFPLKNAIFLNMQRFVAKNSDIITVNSDATRKELEKRFPEYSSKIKTIPMGVDIGKFKNKITKNPEKYSKNKIILFVGRLSDQKGLQYLIDSMKDITRYDSQVKLLIIGTGPYEKHLRNKVRRNNLMNEIEFLGSLAPNEVSKYHNFADVFVLPSLSNKTGTEALGLSLLEAMSSGCAVIGTDVGGLSYIIKNGQNGLLVRQKDPHDLSHAIISVIKNKKKSIMMGKNASEFVRKNYSWESVSKKFIEVYEELLK